MERFSHKMSIAPTASISIIAGNSSPGIEPIAANVFLQKTLSGSFTVRNRHLQMLLAAKGMDTDEIWSSITLRAGSVQHLDFLTEQEKAVYKTAFELDQRWIIEHAADRAPFICQSQSVNVFLPANVHKRDLHQIHFMAWKRGVKSLYYCRSLSIQRADNVSEAAVAPPAFTGLMGVAVNDGQAPLPLAAVATDCEECLACQ
jgi:ribonucleoside-diphosphate reductase alpha chain